VLLLWGYRTGGGRNTDTLKEMWKRQVEFNRKFIDPNDTAKVIPHAKDMVLSMFTENTELLDAMGDWRAFRFNKPEPSKSGILEEGVDIFKFLINTLDSFGITSSDFFEYFILKSEVVEQRYMWEQKLALWKTDPAVRIVAVDLDGVLANYPDNWISYVNNRLGTSFTIRDFVGTLPGGLPISQEDHIRLKHEFRDGGYECMWAEPTPYAKPFLEQLKNRGYRIVIMSARPYKEYKRTQADAIEWMADHELPYDAFLWGRDKALKLHQEAPRAIALVDDDPIAINNAAANGIQGYLVDRPYNKWLDLHSGAIRVLGLERLIQKYLG